MEKIKSSLVNMILVLTLVAAVTGSVLAMVNHVTSDAIAEQNVKMLNAGIQKVVNSEVAVNTIKEDTVKWEEKGKELVFVVHHLEGGKVAVESSTMGFGGNLKILVGFDAEGNILGYTVLEHAETPGLGAKADQWFQADGKGNIIGRNLNNNPLKVKKDGGDIDAITASTITSRAFLKAVNQAYDAFSKGENSDAQSGASKQIKK